MYDFFHSFNHDIDELFQYHLIFRGLSNVLNDDKQSLFESHAMARLKLSRPANATTPTKFHVIRSAAMASVTSIDTGIASL